MEMEMKGKEMKNKGIEMKLGDSQLLLLPEDILVFNILARLPVIDVIRCTSVCKQWRSLIKNPHFVSTHLSFSQPSMYVHHFGPTKRRRFLSSHFDPQSFDNCHIIPLPLPFGSYLIILGPIHGLFCLINGITRSNELYCLWNPSVRRYVRLPLPTPPAYTLMTAYGFGFDCQSKDYIVLLLYVGCCGSPNAPSCRLFSLKQRRWRTLGAAEEIKYCFGQGLLVNGVLHWEAWKYRIVDPSRTFIVAFDISHKTFENMEFPQVLLHGPHKFIILEIKGSLACFEFDDHYENPKSGIINSYSIWVMKDYGVANSWVKMWTFELMGSTLLWVYGFWGNGDDILVKVKGYSRRKHLFLYDTKTQGSKDFGGDAKLEISNIFGYTESLLFLEKESGALSYEEPAPDANAFSGGSSMKRKRERNEGRQLIKSKRR